MVDNVTVYFCQTNLSDGGFLSGFYHVTTSVNTFQVVGQISLHTEGIECSPSQFDDVASLKICY